MEKLQQNWRGRLADEGEVGRRVYAGTIPADWSFLEGMVGFQKSSSSALLPGDNVSLLLLCRIMVLSLLLLRAHFESSTSFLTPWTECFKNILLVLAGKEKTEIPFLLSMKILAFFKAPTFRYSQAPCFSSSSHVCFLPSAHLGLFLILLSLSFEDKTGHNQNSPWHPRVASSPLSACNPLFMVFQPIPN